MKDWLDNIDWAAHAKTHNEIIEYMNKMDELLEKAKKSKKAFKMIKNAAVTVQDYQLAGELRDMENFHFPETSDQKKAKEDAAKFETALRMVGLNSSVPSCWLILETVKSFNEKGGNFSLDDASNLKFKKDYLFDEGE